MICVMRSHRHQMQLERQLRLWVSRNAIVPLALVRRRGATKKQLIELGGTVEFGGDSADLKVGGEWSVQEECNICLETICKGDTLRRLPCPHVFHRDCVDHWLCTNAVCPMC